MKIVILDGYTTNPGDLDWNELEKLGEVVCYNNTAPEQVKERLQGAAVALTNKVPLREDLLKELPDLKYIGILATGMDHVDLKAAKDLGIVVTNIPVYANYSVAQLAIALTLELCYRMDLHHRKIVEEMYWCKQPYNSFWLQPLVGLDGKTMGIIGMGKIGERLAATATALGMKVLAYDVFHREIPNVEWVELNDLLKNSDVVSIHCPLMPATRGMINKDTLALMKPTAFFINTSRGGLMVEQDLADALNNGVIAGAGLDVLSSEPPKEDNPLLTAKNVIITPHIGWATIDARRQLVKIAADNISAFLNGEKRNVVNDK